MTRSFTIIAALTLAGFLLQPNAVRSEEITELKEISCGGIGIILTSQNGIKILSVMPGSPAEAAGIEKTDKILSVDGNDTSAMTFRDVALALRGEPGSMTTVTLERRDGTQRTLTLPRVDLSSLAPSPILDETGEIEETQPSPATMATDTGEALVQILKELQNINARLDKLESQGNLNAERSFRRQGPDRKALVDITYPENPTKDQVREYITRILTASEGQNSFSSSDPQVKMLARVGEENMDLLIEAANGDDGSMSRYHINYTINRIATEKSKDLIIKALGKNRELAEVVVKYGWQEDVRDTLIAGLGSDYLPNSWIEAVVNLNDPSTYDALLQHLVAGNNRSQTYELIKDLPGIPLDASIEKAWGRAKRSHVWERSNMAIIALDYGYQDALESLVRALSASEIKNNSHMREKIEFAILDHTDITESDLNNISAWFASVKDTLTFDPATKRFTRTK